MSWLPQWVKKLLLTEADPIKQKDREVRREELKKRLGGVPKTVEQAQNRVKEIESKLKTSKEKNEQAMQKFSETSRTLRSAHADLQRLTKERVDLVYSAMID